MRYEIDFTAKTHRRGAESAEFYIKPCLCALCVSAVKTAFLQWTQVSGLWTN